MSASLRTRRQWWKSISNTAADYGRRRELYERFDADISKLLSERGYSVPKQAPNIWEMLKRIGEAHLYQFYILLFANSHTNFEAGGLYRENLGCGKGDSNLTGPASSAMVQCRSKSACHPEVASAMSRSRRPARPRQCQLPGWRPWRRSGQGS